LCGGVSGCENARLDGASFGQSFVRMAKAGPVHLCACSPGSPACVDVAEGAQIPKPSAGNYDTAILVATFRCTTVCSSRRRSPRRPLIQEYDPPFAPWRDPDPSRIALWHGNDDFERHAYRDHAELPDSVAELPFGARAGLPARRFRSSRSDLDRTNYRQGPESGSEHTETSCNPLLHWQSATHYPQTGARLQPRSDQACRRARSCQGAAWKPRSMPLWQSDGRP
jgi:hypothetical protein